MLEVHIEKKFKNFSLKADFENESGILGILGASGSGKSLCLKSIAGIVRPDKGRIVLDDRVLFDSDKKINVPTKKRRVAYLFQDYALFPNMTVIENIRTGFREKRDNQEEEIAKKMEELHLSHIKNVRADKISGGEKQRTALARILVNEPEILLLDEPYSAIDGYLRWSIELEVRNIIEKYNIPTLFVSHDRDESFRMCDSIVVMSKGKSESKKSTKELFSNPETLAAAELSGCKNFSDIIKKSENIYFAEKWGLEISTKKDYKEKCIGIRGHDIKITRKEEYANTYPLEIVKEIEEIFRMCLIIRKKGGSGEISVFLDKEEWGKLRKEDKLYFTFDEDKIMFLN